MLTDAGFAVRRMTFGEGAAAVPNLIATIGRGAPHLVFAGHTDVVPPGDAARWSHPPFGADDRRRHALRARRGGHEGRRRRLHRRRHSASSRSGTPRGTLSLLITGDEEGAAVNGTVKLLGVGEGRGPSASTRRWSASRRRRRASATPIKIGRRGSLSGTIRVTGKQGHVAYPERADNPIPPLAAILDRLAKLKLDDGSAAFPAVARWSSPASTSATRRSTSSPARRRRGSTSRFNDRWSAETLEAHLQARDRRRGRRGEGRGRRSSRVRASRS